MAESLLVKLNFKNNSYIYVFSMLSLGHHSDIRQYCCGLVIIIISSIAGGLDRPIWFHIFFIVSYLVFGRYLFTPGVFWLRLMYITSISVGSSDWYRTFHSWLACVQQIQWKQPSQKQTIKCAYFVVWLQNNAQSKMLKTNIQQISLIRKKNDYVTKGT